MREGEGVCSMSELVVYCYVQVIKSSKLYVYQVS